MSDRLNSIFERLADLEKEVKSWREPLINNALMGVNHSNHHKQLKEQIADLKESQQKIKDTIYDMLKKLSGTKP